MQGLLLPVKLLHSHLTWYNHTNFLKTGADMSIYDSIAETLAALKGVSPADNPPRDVSPATTVDYENQDTAPVELDIFGEPKRATIPTDELPDYVKEPTLPLNEIASIVERPSPPAADDYYGIEYKAPVMPQVGTVPFHLWESLAYDLALGHPPSEELATAYSSTLPELMSLIESPYFTKLLNAKKEEVEEVGPRASTVTKFRVITSMGMREYMRRVTSPDTSDKDFHSLFKLALEMAELTPPPQAKEAGVEIKVGAGDGMTFNVYSIPGLEHLASNAVDVTPTEVVDEVEFVDVPPTEVVDEVDFVGITSPGDTDVTDTDVVDTPRTIQTKMPYL